MTKKKINQAVKKTKHSSQKLLIKKSQSNLNRRRLKTIKKLLKNKRLVKKTQPKTAQLKKQLKKISLKQKNQSLSKIKNNKIRNNL